MKKKKLFYLLFVSFTVFFVLSNYAMSYIDPGTGSIIISSIWPFILAFFSAIGAFIIKVFWKPIKQKILNFKKNKKRKK